MHLDRAIYDFLNNHYIALFKVHITKARRLLEEITEKTYVSPYSISLVATKLMPVPKIS